MKLFFLFLVVIFVLVSFEDCHACGGGSCATECRNYKELSDGTRHHSYGGGVKNDAHLDGWYRFVGRAGTRMLTSCLTMNKCNTACLGHLVGGHPSVSEGIVTRKACFSCYSNCCSSTTQIKVRNCGSFYVYKLKSIPFFARLRYCGEGERSN